MPAADAARGGGRQETVLLLHGLGRSPLSMVVLARRVREAGFDAEVLGYPSMRRSFDELVELVAAEVERREASGTGPVHFVTHSLGGILVRAYLDQRSADYAGRVVMLAPPNHGSEIVDAFGASPLLRSGLGPVGSRLGTDEGDLPASLGPPDFELGIIAGDGGFNPVASKLIGGPNDGKVAVESAWLSGAGEFLVVGGSHTFIMNRPDVAAAVVSFLQHGSFEAGRDATDDAGGQR